MHNLKVDSPMSLNRLKYYLELEKQSRIFMLEFMCSINVVRYIHLRLQKPFGKVWLPFFEFGLPFPWKRSIEGDSKSRFQFLEQRKSWRRKQHVEFLFEDRLLEEIQARGDSRITTPAMQIEPAEVMLKRGK